MKEFDCIVVGGGMVGATAALSLAHLGLTVAVIEQTLPNAFDQAQTFDLRVSAISLASEHLLEQVNAWQQIQQWRICPYRRLGVWEQPYSYTEFSAQDIEQSHLGHIVENRLLQLSLWQQLDSHQNINLYCPESLQRFEQLNDEVIVQLTGSQIKGKLLIAADGANSQVRTLAGIGTTGWDYQQAAMIINVETQKEQQDITWQQFLSTGPVAMLPMPGNNASLVWYHQKEEINQLVNLSNKQLEEKITENFPKRLGKVKVTNKASFPLTRRHANHYQNKRVLLLGDAAHSINPLAGQGVNLGFKDVKALQKVIATAISDNKCWHDVDTLKGYEQARRKDNLMMMTGMDAIYAGFSHPSPLVKFVRNAGLFLTNKAPVLKRKALAYACGL